MKTYLVTGAAGFIGVRFVESCTERGTRVIAVDRLTHFDGRPEHAAIDMPERVDRDALDRWLAIETNAHQIAAVIHLGACANTMETDESFLNRVNVEYSQKLWRFATLHQIPFVYASSAATYGDGAFGYDDDEAQSAALQPLNLYGWSKQKFDLWALAEEKAGRKPPAWSGFKFFNVYGFGERHKGKMASVVLSAFDQITREGRAKLFRSHREGIADGEQKRDFIAVEDVIKVLHFAAEKPIRRGIFNLGTGRASSFLELVHATFAAMKREPQIEFIDTPEAIREKYQYFTEAKMQRLRSVGYADAFMPLSEGVKRYVARLKA